MELWTTQLVREEIGPFADGEETIIRGPEDIASIMVALTADSPVEKFYVFCLNTSHNIIGFSLISSGLLDASLVHPREVFRTAILSNAAAIICGHNHPTGNTDLSKEDKMVFRQLREAGQVLGIPCLDLLATNHLGDFSGCAMEGIA